MVAIESTGTIDQQGQLILNRPLNLRNQKVNVLILVPELTDDEAWLTTLTSNAAFDFSMTKPKISIRSPMVSQ